MPKAGISGMKLLPKRGVIRVLAASFITLAVAMTAAPSPTTALFIDDYFDLNYDIELSTSSVRGSDTFYADITGTATCTQDLPLTITDGYVKFRVVAKNQDTGDEYMLNESFTLDIDPFPNDEGESTEASATVSLTFQENSPAGEYDVAAKLIKARANTLLLGEIPVTKYLPSREEMGSVSYIPLDEDVELEDTTDIQAYMDEEGAFIDDFLFTLEGNGCQILIAEGTTALDPNGDPIDELTIEALDTPPSPPQGSHIIGVSYDLEPDGTEFNPPISLIISYEPSLIPDDIAEADLQIAIWDEDEAAWVMLNGTVNTADNTITVSIEHFTTFAVMGTTPTPADINPTTIAIHPAQAGPGETVAVIVNAVNTGSASGTYRLSLIIDGQVVQTKEITIGGNSEGQAAFTITKDSPGTYAVEVNGLTGTFSIKEAASSPTPTEPGSTPPTTPTQPEDRSERDTANPVNWQLIVTIAGIATAVAIPLALRRRTSR